jgi:phosphoribosylamine--glycine ligase
VDIAATDIPALVTFAREQHIGLTFVGPEAPLACGIVDVFTACGLRCFGPSAEAARLEASKAYAKAFMLRHGIPTARWEQFTDLQEALAYLDTVEGQVVVKASGLAAGKGAIVTSSKEEAIAAARLVLEERAFGDAGDVLIIEERLTGEEVSVLGFCDGKTVCVMPPAQDHKRVFEDDKGPNTGGMGAYAPAPVLDTEGIEAARLDVLQRTVDGLATEGIHFVGILYAGLMMTPDGPSVLEFNCRFGDPETQVIVPLLETDLADVFDACLDGTLDQLNVRWSAGAAATVVGASEGYPSAYPKGREIRGIDAANATEGVTVFHAGTRHDDGQFVTSGGRVLAVTGVGSDLPQALARAYRGLEQIEFEGMHYRRDIGGRALARLQDQER